MQVDLNRRQFDQCTISRVVPGLRVLTMHQWIHRGYLAGVQSKIGSGNRRLYSAIDIAQIAVLYKCSKLGIPPIVAKGITGRARARFEQLISDNLIMDGKAFAVFKLEDGEAIEEWFNDIPDEGDIVDLASVVLEEVAIVVIQVDSIFRATIDRLNATDVKTAAA